MPDIDFGKDNSGQALVCSNSAGKNPDNFFYNICTDPQYGFTEFHATTMDNPRLPKQLANESAEDWLRRRDQFHKELISANAPLVYAQENLAKFVDWSGVAFFSREKLLVDGNPVPYPINCDGVYAVIDTASKTGTDNDATAVTYFAHSPFSGSGAPLLILDWDVIQIEGALLETWLPQVFLRIEDLAGKCRAQTRVAWRVYRGQKLRDDPTAAGEAPRNESDRNRIQAHCDGQG